MKAVIQRVSEARVKVKGEVVGEIGKGAVVLLGIKRGDTEREAEKIGKKIANLRIVDDENKKMNLSIKEINGEILLISQFTLYGNPLKGRRPSFDEALPSKEAYLLYKEVKETIQNEGIHTETGKFGEYMQVELTNQGPVTIILEI